jgi:hypothetical protein
MLNRINHRRINTAHLLLAGLALAASGCATRVVDGYFAEAGRLSSVDGSDPTTSNPGGPGDGGTSTPTTGGTTTTSPSGGGSTPTTAPSGGGSTPTTAPSGGGSTPTTAPSGPGGKGGGEKGEDKKDKHDGSCDDHKNKPEESIPVDNPGGLEDPQSALDISCGNSNGKKVLICHVPPGNPARAHTLCISVNGATHGHGVLMPTGADSTVTRAAVGANKSSATVGEGGHGGDYAGPCQEQESGEHD